MVTKKEMIKYLLDVFKKNNKKSKFLIEDLREYKAFLNQKTLTELKETYLRQKAINEADEKEFYKECCLNDLF